MDIKPAKRYKDCPFGNLIDFCRITDPFQVSEHDFIALINGDIDNPENTYQFYEILKIIRIDKDEISMYLIEVDESGKLYTESKYKKKFHEDNWKRFKEKGYSRNWMFDREENLKLLHYKTSTIYEKRSTFIKPDSDTFTQRFDYYDENGFLDTTDEFKSKFENYDPEFDLKKASDNDVKHIIVPSRGDWNVRDNFYVQKLLYIGRKNVANQLTNTDLLPEYYSAFGNNYYSEFREALSQLDDNEFKELLSKIRSTSDLNSYNPTYQITRELKDYCSKWRGIWIHVRKYIEDEQKCFSNAKFYSRYGYYPN